MFLNPGAHRLLLTLLLTSEVSALHLPHRSPRSEFQTLLLCAQLHKEIGDDIQYNRITGKLNDPKLDLSLRIFELRRLPSVIFCEKR